MEKMQPIATLFVLLFININFITSEYCYYREDKEGKNNYLECEFFERNQPIEGISLIHLKHNTTIPIIEKSLLSPFKNLKTLYITAANVERIEPGALHNYKLEMVDLYHNNLKSIENGTFSSQNVLKCLDVSYNKFESLEADTFSDLVSLEWLSLISNKISTINKAAFSNLKKLRALFLRFNKIEKLEANTFQNLVSLELLDLSFNSLVNIPSDLFSNQKQLQNLDMKHNYLENLPDHVFDNMDSLMVLNISQNKMSVLQDSLFYNTKELKILKINSNYISHFNATSLLAHTPKLEEVYLYHNQWKCDHLKKIVDDFKEKFVHLAISTPVLSSDVNGIGCHK